MPERMDSRLWGSTATVGSSRMMRSGLCAAGDVEATEQSTRELLRAELLEFLESYEGDSVIHQCTALRPVWHIERAEAVHVLAYRELVEDGNLLGHDSDVALEVVACGLHGLAEEFDLAMVIGQKLQDAVDGCRLAGAVGTQESEHLARHDIEGEMAYGNELAVALHEVVDVDDGCAGFHGGLLSKAADAILRERRAFRK